MEYLRILFFHRRVVVAQEHFRDTHFLDEVVKRIDGLVLTLHGISLCVTPAIPNDMSILVRAN